MLTWINEKAKWIIAISAVGIGVGLLAMDNIPDQNARYPLGEVNGRKISAEEFASRFQSITENNRGQHMDDEQYARLRADLFQSFVRQYVLDEKVKENKLQASVPEMKDELLKNPDAVRNILGSEAQQRLYMIQANASSAEEANTRIQSYIASLPRFLTDSTFDKSAYEAWLNTPEAYEWASMMRYEQDLKYNTIPMKQLQTFIAASIHPTSLEAQFSVNQKLSELDIQLASVSAKDFFVPQESIDDAAVQKYFDENKDSFYVEQNMMQVNYVALAIEPSEKDEANLKDYAMTLYNQLKDSSATFAELAKLSSEDASTAENEGVLGDYTGRGVWVKPFEDVAFALDSGAISEPVKTPFGFHIIQSLGKKKDSLGNDLVKAAHILITVTASSETEDSLSGILTKVKEKVLAGESFENASKTLNLEPKTSEYLTKGNFIDNIGYLQGFSSFLFVNENNPEPSGNISEVLKNKKFVVLAMKKDSLVAGTRNIAPYKASIRSTLQKQAEIQKAKDYLNSQAAKVKSWVSDYTKQEIEKVSLTTEHVALSSYLPALGYGNSILSNAHKNQKLDEWGNVIETENGAVMICIYAETKPAEEAIQKAIQNEIQNTYRFSLSALVSDYVQSLEQGASVTNNLDLYYKD